MLGEAWVSVTILKSLWDRLFAGADSSWRGYLEDLYSASASASSSFFWCSDRIFLRKKAFLRSDSARAVAKFQVSALLQAFHQVVPGGGALHLQELDVGVQVGDPSAEPGLRRIRGVIGCARPRAGHDEKGGQQSRRDGAAARSRHRCDSSSIGSASPSQKLLDRIVDSFLVTDLGEGEIRDFVEGFLELAVELARSVGALDLPVAEEVALGQELVAQEADAVAVILAPVVAVGEVEYVDVPVDGGMGLVDDLVRQRVGRADPRSAAFPGMVEGVLVDLAGHRVVDDVAGGHAVVLAFQPGVDPEGLGPDDLLLVVGHRARHVHQVEHHRAELGHGDRVPGTVELIFADRDDQGIARVVLARGDLALECLLVGALEVAQAFRAGLADAGVLVLLFHDVGAALGHDPGQRELLTQDLGKVVHGELDLEDMMPRCLGGPMPRLAVAGSPDRGPHVAGPLPHAAAVLGPVAELGDLDLRQRDRHEFAARLADQLAVGDVLAQVRLDLPADDLLEPIGISIDFSHHGSPAPAVACIWIHDFGQTSSSRKVSRRCVPGYWPNSVLSCSRIARPAVAQGRNSLELAEHRASGVLRGPERLTIRPQVRWKRTDWFPPARIRISAVVSIRKGRSWQQFFRGDPVPG